MGKDEFFTWAKANGSEKLNLIADQHNVSENGMYHSCRFCGFETACIEELQDMGQIDRLDDQMLSHIWYNHRPEALKICLKSIAEEIAAKPGQMKLI